MVASWLVGPDNLVLLEVPAFDDLVVASGEEVRVALADDEPADLPNMAGQCELQSA